MEISSHVAPSFGGHGEKSVWLWCWTAHQPVLCIGSLLFLSEAKQLLERSDANMLLAECKQLAFMREVFFFLQHCMDKDHCSLNTGHTILISRVDWEDLGQNCFKKPYKILCITRYKLRQETGCSSRTLAGHRRGFCGYWLCTMN